MKHWVLFALACLIAPVLGGAQGLSREAGSQEGIHFELNREFGSILVTAQVNGRPAVMVLDTGSNRTILSADFLRLRPQDIERAESPSKGSGLVGSAGWAKATLQIGRDRWPDRRVLVMSDFPEISTSMKQKVDGILGEDILREFDFVGIDFKHQRLLLQR